jgi:hypothetical protein
MVLDVLHLCALGNTRTGALCSVENVAVEPQ